MTTEPHTLVLDQAGVAVQTVTIAWWDASKHQPPPGTAVWLILEELTPCGRHAYGDRMLEFGQYSPSRVPDDEGWELIGGIPIGPDHQVVAWAYPPELPPRFNACQNDPNPEPQGEGAV